METGNKAYETCQNLNATRAQNQSQVLEPSPQSINSPHFRSSTETSQHAVKENFELPSRSLIVNSQILLLLTPILLSSPCLS